MDKRELLDALATKFYQVLTPEPQRDEAGVKWYLVGTYDKLNGVMRRQNVSFYVENEGQAEETAYWANSEPKPTLPTPVPTFGDRVNEYITVKITEGVIEEGSIERVNEQAKTAVVKALMIVTNQLTELRFLVDEDSQGNLQHTQIEVNL